MILQPLPDEHIYSYLYRSYIVHGVSALHTIVNSDGLFKQRLALIKLEYIKDFVPDNECRDWNKMISLVLERSGFLLFDLNTAKINRTLNGKKLPLGLKVLPLNKTRPDKFKYCLDCVRGFINDYGAAYLTYDWLGDATECQKHNNKLTVAECANLNEARKSLAKIFLGLDVF